MQQSLRLYVPEGCSLHIDCRIHVVYIFLVQFLPEQLNGFAEPLEVNNFPFTQEFDHVIHIRVIRNPQDIIIGCACLLLWERIP